MKEQMKENEGWFDMDVMLQFKRLASICSEPTTILEALSDADKSLLEVPYNIVLENICKYICSWEWVLGIGLSRSLPF